MKLSRYILFTSIVLQDTLFYPDPVEELLNFTRATEIKLSWGYKIDFLFLERTSLVSKFYLTVLKVVVLKFIEKIKIQGSKVLAIWQ